MPQKTKAELAVEMVLRHPLVPMGDIAKLLGVSTQYVGRLVKENPALAELRSQAKAAQKAKKSALLGSMADVLKGK